MDKTLKNCNLIRTILIITIVLYHSLLYLNGSWFTQFTINRNDIISIITQWLNTFLTYGLTFVSGYVFYYLKFENNKYEKYVPFLWNKCKRLLIPFFVTSLICVIPVQIAISGFDLNRFFDVILGKSPEQLWFLLMLFIVFALFWPISKLVKNKIWLGVIISLASFAFGLLGSRFIPNYFQVWTALKFVPFFYLGFVSRQKINKYIRKIPFYIYLIINVGLFALFLFTNRNEGTFWSILNVGLSFVISIFGTLMVWTLFQLIGNHCNWENRSVLQYLDRRSFVIYLFHQQVVILSVFLLYGKISDVVLILINIASSLGISLLISELILHIKFIRPLFGYKYIN